MGFNDIPISGLQSFGTKLVSSAIIASVNIVRDLRNQTHFTFNQSHSDGELRGTNAD